MKLGKDEIQQVEKDTSYQGNDSTGMWLCIRCSRHTELLILVMQAENFDTSLQHSKKTCYTVRHPLNLHCVGVGRMRITQEGPTLGK